ncbi:putative nwd2 protein [Mycena sanguinolenta]|uniref:Putative nwd2 protein n=1 Tax=Mycena sanguinolenta TaxID=230812 RepID=A0A8H6Z951_9AGAR|nr:putative nwd2 protein [Mycena sanguinolenta]
MPTDCCQSRAARSRGSVFQTWINYISGGRGGSGGDGHGNGGGGAGGHGMGPSLSFDISVGSHFTMHNNVHGNDGCVPGDPNRQNAIGGDPLHDSRSGPLIHQNIHQHGDRGIDILHHAVALEAIHDSTDSFPQPKCHPETRTQMLEDLGKWASDQRPKTTILWLYGPAGAGKSAIMRTLATQFDEDGRLGGCFFFKRGHATRGNAKTLFATIAYQLALNIEWLRTPISQVMEKNPTIVARSIGTQIQKLIAEPCRTHKNREPVVCLIDGLDECDGHAFQEEILRAILNPSSNHAIFLRFIVASRSEPQISKMFPLPDHSCNYRRFNVEQSFDDVRKYLHDEFSRIHRDHSTMAKIPSPWPEPSVMEKLVQKSSGYFIYASTIIKFIGDENFRPTVRLEVVHNTNGPGSKSAYDALDQLYMTILRSALRQSELIPIVCAIVHFEFQLTTDDIDKLFGLTQGETQLILRGLHSLLNIPQDDEHKILSHHALFGDFLNNPDRSGNFCVNFFEQSDQSGSIPPPVLCSTLSNLIRFIVSLPPSGGVAELFLLIGSVNPDYIFDLGSDHDIGDLVAIASWLKTTPSAPANVIELWEDYAFMISIDTMHRCSVGPSVEHIVSPSPVLLCILVSLGLLSCRLLDLPTKLDLTWTDLRTTLSLSLVSRDLALQFIRKMVKNHIDTNKGVDPSASRDAVLLYDSYDPSIFRNLEEAYTCSQYWLGRNISYLVRLSPPCAVLSHELWSIPTSEIWSSQPSGPQLIHHVSKWLESFPDSAMELIRFWQQAEPEEDRGHMNIWNLGPDGEESGWLWRVKNYNDMIIRLQLENNLKIPL